MDERKRVICVVLAGGFGTRLYPLTEAKPKPLVKILDTTVLENVINAVKRTCCQKIIVSTFYKTEMIEEKCRKIDKNIVCRKEKFPLGTAGGVKNCIEGEYDAVMVVSGDAVFDFDLQRAIEFHFENNCEVTVISAHREKPINYGVILCDTDGNITGFEEKPSWKRVKSDRVNTGIYILSKNSIDRIPERRKYDFSENLFPKLLKEGCKIMAFDAVGVWYDIGSIEEYCACNRFVAGEGLGCLKNNGATQQSLLSAGIHSQAGAYVSLSAEIGRNVSISKGSVICENVRIFDDCDISLSVISAYSSIGKGSSINGAVIGDGAVIGENCIIPEGCVIGDGVMIADGTVLAKNTRTGKNCQEKERRRVGGIKEAVLFMEDAVIELDKKGAAAELWSVAYAASDVFGGGKSVSFAIMHTKGAENSSDIFSFALAALNISVFTCGEGNEAMCAFAIKRLEAAAGIFVSECDSKIKITVFNQNGDYIDEKTERKVTKSFLKASEEDGLFTGVLAGKGARISLPAYELYKNSLCRFFLKMLSGATGKNTKVKIAEALKEREAMYEMLSELLSEHGFTVVAGSEKGAIEVNVTNDGTRGQLKFQGKFYDHEHICAAILKNSALLGLEGVNLGENAPQVLKNYVKNSGSGSSAFSPFSDGYACICAFLALLALTGESADALFSCFPAFEIYKDDYICDVNRGATMERLSRLYNDSKNREGDGILLTLAEGNVTVIPNKMKGFKIISEAVNMETAKELAFRIGEVIRNE